MSTLTFEHAARSETGRRRNNEDSVFASVRLVAVADGVGGAAAGEVASRLAIGALAGLESRYLEDELGNALEAAFAEGNDRIRFVAACRPGWAGMASTLAAVALDDDGRYVIANIGDSRLYLLRERSLLRLTTDDTYVQRLVDGGALSEDEARRHPRRSVVLNVLDGEPRRVPRLRAETARDGDRLLLCSDGLTDLVDDATLAHLLMQPDRESCADALVRAALGRGGSDNVSVVVVDVVGRETTIGGWRRV